MNASGSSPTLTVVALPERLPDWGVLVLESHHADNFSMDWRTHPFLKVVYALSGAGRVLIEDETHRFGPRDVLVVPPNHRNRIVDEEGSASSLYVFCLATELLHFDPTLIDQISPGRLHASNRLAIQVQQRLRRLLFEQATPNPLRTITMVADAIELLSLLVRQPMAASDQCGDPVGELAEMDAYVKHLDSHFYEATTIDAAAEQLGMRRRRFTALFKQATQSSWLAYVRRRRIEYATQLLRDTSLPITSVAFECGFEDLSTFYRQFKRESGVAPGEWRENQT